MRAPAFEEGTLRRRVRPRRARRAWCRGAGAVAPELSDEASVYSALVLGVRDYVRKHGFPGRGAGALRRGGLGADAGDRGGCARATSSVQAVMMPSRYTSQMSVADAQGAGRSSLGVQYSVLSIESMFEATLATLKERVRRPPGRCHRGEHPVALPHAAAHGRSPTRPGACCSPPATRARWRSATPRCTATWPAASRPSRTAASCWCIAWRNYRNSLGRVIPQRVIERAAVGGAARRPEGLRLAAALRGAGRDPRGLHRGGPVGG